jgi:carboxyl-terminal processing protease
MQELSLTQGLVIDIRTNSGGNISAMRLASYFIDHDGPAFALMSRPYLEKLGRPVTAADVASAPKVIGRYRGEDVMEALSKGHGAATFYAEDLGDKRYRAPVAVLIGQGTGSAAEGFAWGMKTYSHARLVGAPTAGAILSGEDFEVAPSWNLTVPVAGHWSAAGEDLNDKPVTPHETVPQTRADICAGRDRGVERAIAIIAGG